MLSFVVVYLLMAIVWTIGLLLEWRLMGTKEDFRTLYEIIDRPNLSDFWFLVRIVLAYSIAGLLWPVMVYHRVSDIRNGGW